MRGSILDSDVRAPINIWIYLKTGKYRISIQEERFLYTRFVSFAVVMLFDISWLILGSIWLSKYYLESPVNTPKQIFFGKIFRN